MKNRLSFFIIFCWLALSATAALIPEMKFRRLDTRNGLSNSQVNCVLKDQRGYVWIGTPYGLNRYDGYHIKSFYSNIRDTTSIRDNYVDYIYEAYNGKLWLELGMNYCIYDPVTEHFERNIHQELAQYGIDGSVDNLFIDSKRNFWVKINEGGLKIYNPYEKTSKEVKTGYEKGQLNPQYVISQFAEHEQFMLLSTTNGELLTVDPKTATVIWETDWVRQNSGIENQKYRIAVDKAGNIWVMVIDRTFVFDKARGQWYKSFKEYFESLGIEGCPDNLLVWNVMFDKQGWAWLATDHEGVIVVNVEDRQLRQFKNNKLDESTISDNTIRQCYQSDDGHVWVATYKNGICQYRPSISDIHCIELGDINTVTVDHSGRYWVGTNGQGIIVYDPRSQETLHHFTASNSALVGNTMVSSCTAADGSIWFGTYLSGLVHIWPADNAASSSIYNYRATGDADGLASSSVWGVTEDRWHRIWMSTLGGGLQCLNPKTGKFRTWNPKNTQLPSSYLTTVSWIKKGWLMVGTPYYYSFVNPVTGKLANRIIPESPDISVNTANTTCAIEDSRGLIWQGSASGATVYDPTSNFIKLLDMSDGLSESSISSIVEDQQHAIWLITDHGASKVQPQQQKNGTWQFIVRSYTVRDGLQHGTYNPRSASLTPDGLLVIGGQDGVDVINPKLLCEDSNKEKPFLSGLQVFDRDVEVGQKVGGHVILEKALSEIDCLDLRYSENNFTIKLGSDAGVVQNDKRFVYMLEGFHAEWVRTPMNYPNISFMSLRYGDYKLRVRMLNDDGTMGEQEATLDIQVSAPLWRARWAMLLYVVLVLVAVWVWRRYFLRRHAERMRQWRERMSKKGSE